MLPRLISHLAGILLLAFPTGPLGSLACAELPVTETGSVPLPTPSPLAAGDRVILLGDGFIERMQNDGYLETRLTSRLPATSVTFRNLGWSGDTVQGIARAVFGSPDEGFARLLKDVTEAEPTVILVAYGGNEAHAGEAGLEIFHQQLRRMLDELSATGARLVLIAPRPYEKLSPPLPDPAPYNRKLEQYVAVLQNEAAERQVPLLQIDSHAKVPLSPLTTDGIHLTEAGSWHVAGQLATELGYADAPWELDLDVRSGVYNAVNVSMQSWETSENRHEWMLLDRFLPAPFPPGERPPSAEELPYGRMRIRGLPAGSYQLLVEGVPAVTATARQWSAGRPLPLRAGQVQVEELRRRIHEKNELYFHRYRPQNETYLFLFRKHEQGNNAVEIPQFDPLIAEKEDEIAGLRSPRPGKYELVRIQ
jgi:lysophospholipase L1-like esterase